MRKRKITNTLSQSKRDFGVLTDASKAINEVLGDKSGRTVSMRTAHGFKNSFELTHMNEETAEDIVHSGMIASGALIFSKNEAAQVGGLLLLLGLVACYQNGK